MPQYKTWEQEYRKPKLVTKSTEPQTEVKKFIKFLRKEVGIKLASTKTLDLGSGTGKNSYFLALRGSSVTGLEISDTAIKIAKKYATEKGQEIKYLKHDIGSIYPFPDKHFDIILDVISSNSLDEKERAIYLKETRRVLKDGGYFFVRALCRDGDKNANNLFKTSRGKEYGTYIIKDINLIERVFSKEDFIKMYSKYFKIVKLYKQTNYTSFGGKKFKRNFWIAYLTY